MSTIDQSVPPPDDYVGREWLDDEVDLYLRGDKAYGVSGTPLLLVGEPGLGKTTYLQHMVGVRRPIHHFCSRLRPLTLDPGRFARTLGQQLAAALPDRYGDTLGRQQGVHISVSQDIGKMLGGQAIGVYIKYLVASDAHDLFVRLIADPLLDMCDELTDPVVFVVDALDESLLHPGRVTIPDLMAIAADLPAQVRWIATSRPAPEVFQRLPHAGVVDLKTVAAAQLADDARRYIALAVEQPTIRSALDAGRLDPAIVATHVERKSHCNFLYLRLLFRAIASGNHPVTDIDAIPSGLEEIYTTSLEHLARQAGTEAWNSPLRPVIGILTVAREPLTFDQVVQLSNCEPSDVQDALNALEPLLAKSGSGPTTTYRPFHPSLAEVLHNRQLNPTRWIDPAQHHARIVRAYRGDKETWADVELDRLDDYGLRHLASHLLRSGAPEVDGLFELIGPSFREAKARRFHSDASFIDDVVRAIEAAEATGLAGLARALPLGFGVAALREFVRSVPGVGLAALARAGDLDEALGRMASLAPDEAVTGMCRIATDLAAASRIDDARAVVQGAIQRAIDAATADETGALAALFAGVEPLVDQPWLLEIMDPVVFAVEELADVDVMRQCALLLARLRPDERAADLLRHADEVAHQIPDAGNRMRVFTHLADAWRAIGHDEPRQAELRRAAYELASEHLGEEGGELDPHVASALVGAGHLDELLEVVATVGTDSWTLLVEALTSRSDIDHVWAWASQREGPEDASRLSVLLCHRLSEIGEPAEALSRLRSLETSGLPELEAVTERVVVRLAMANQQIEAGADIDSARALLMESLELMEAATEADVSRDFIPLMDDPTEAALLQLAGLIAEMPGDAEWSRQSLEAVLQVLLTKQPPWMFWFVDPDVWRAREQATVARWMAELGHDARAQELMDGAITNAVASTALSRQSEGLESVANALSDLADHPWVPAMCRRIVDALRLHPSSEQVEAALALARHMRQTTGEASDLDAALGEVHGMVTEIAERNRRQFEREDDDPDVTASLSALIDFHASSTARPSVSDDFRTVWPLVFEVRDGEGRTDLLEALVPAWSEIDADGSDQAILALPPGLDRAVALASKGAAGDAIAELDHLEWDDGLALVVSHALDAIPDDAEPDTVSSLLDAALARAWALDWRSITQPGVTVDDWALALPEALSGVTASTLFELAGQETTGEPDVALRFLLDEIEADKHRVKAHGAIATRGVRLGSPAHAMASLRWTGAAMDWADAVTDVVRESWPDWWPEFWQEWLRLVTTAIESVRSLIDASVEASGTALAEQIIDDVLLDMGRAYLRAVLAGHLLEAGDRGEATGLVDQAIEELGLPDEDVAGLSSLWPDPAMAIVDVLIRLGRVEHAMDLAGRLGSVEARNDARDAIAAVLVESSAVEQAIEVLGQVEPGDPSSIYRDSVHAHRAVEDIVRVLLDRGEVERAIDVLAVSAGDLWALIPNALALRQIGDKLAELAAGEPDRVARLAFAMLRSASDTAPGDVLGLITALAPVLEVAGAGRPAECWRNLRTVTGWFCGAAQPS